MSPPVGEPVVDGVPLPAHSDHWRVVNTRFVFSITAALLLCASLVCTLIDHDFSRPDAPVSPVRFASFLLEAWALILILFAEWRHARKQFMASTRMTLQAVPPPLQHSI